MKFGVGKYAVINIRLSDLLGGVAVKSKAVVQSNQLTRFNTNTFPWLVYKMRRSSSLYDNFQNPPLPPKSCIQRQITEVL